MIMNILSGENHLPLISNLFARAEGNCKDAGQIVLSFVKQNRRKEFDSARRVHPCKERGPATLLIRGKGFERRPNEMES